MLVLLHVSFADGRHVQIAREVSEEEAGSHSA